MAEQNNGAHDVQESLKRELPKLEQLRKQSDAARTAYENQRNSVCGKGQLLSRVHDLVGSKPFTVEGMPGTWVVMAPRGKATEYTIGPFSPPTPVALGDQS